MKTPRKTSLVLTAITLFLLTFISCTKEETDDLIAIEDPDFEIPDWTEETHSKSADPNFDEVFDDDAVKRLDFVITESRWESMLDNMTDLYGTFGVPSAGPGQGLIDAEDPMFVPAEVFYNGKQWYKVGIRFKGNSSLQSSWGRGILKLSFKMDLDEYEDDYPQIDNQRFYGFKKFSLKNNYDDMSFMRDKVSSKVFQNAGLAVSNTAFYTLYVDHGDGAEYFGLYTLVEEVDNTVIKTQFSDNDGNLYKPEGTGASFVYGTFNETDFEKKTNEDELDWSDINALFAALHDETRSSDPASWRANLDAVFNTDKFLNYLAINTVIQNWDSYGRMTQNFYLYNDPDNSLLTWIPWDYNEAIQEGRMIRSLALDFSDIQSGYWPLIEYLYADDVYRAIYDGYVEETRDNYFEENTMKALYTRYSNLIQEYATTEIDGYSFLNSSIDFQASVSALKTHVSSRKSAVNNYLSK
ncbi:MAG: CotH kinase family protein [Bacteroidales bacterium]|nr:CotH kinase family protein [Bacteroidales bacterium]